MTDERTLDELDTSLAQRAGALLKSILTAARERESAEKAAIIDGLTTATLLITADGPQLKIEVRAPVNGETWRIWGGTFQEAVLQ